MSSVNKAEGKNEVLANGDKNVETNGVSADISRDSPETDTELDHEPEEQGQKIELQVEDSELAEFDDEKVDQEIAKETPDQKPASNTDPLAKPVKKSKRKFGLEYIIVCLNTANAACLPAAMKDSPHECVLCLPAHTFNAVSLARHIASTQHLLNVLETVSRELHETMQSCTDAAQLFELLSREVAQPSAPVKLQVVQADKLQEKRNQILELIQNHKSKLSTPTPAALPAFDLRSKLSVGKRSLLATPPTAKRPRLDGQELGEEVLVVGDERAGRLLGGTPGLVGATAVVLPGAGLEAVLHTAAVRVTRTTRIIVLVSILHDFVQEKPGSKVLFMQNPDVGQISDAIGRFSVQMAQSHPTLRVMVLVPSYVDFIRYSMRLRHLSPADFARLEGFSLQIMDGFKALYAALRYMAKNVFAFDMNYTLCDSKKPFPALMAHRPPPAKEQMRFFDGTLTDGLHLSDEAYTRLAEAVYSKVQSMVVRARPTALLASPTIAVVDSWASSDHVLVVGDHHVFHFDADLMPNVSLVQEKSKTLEMLLERADQMLDDSVDVLILVGLYREFAQNVQYGSNTLLEPVLPDVDQLTSILLHYKNKWISQYSRLTVVFTIPQVLDFYTYNSTNNPTLGNGAKFVRDMTMFSHQHSKNIMSVYKAVRPAVTMGTPRVWLYHTTNALYQHHKELLQTLGDFSVEPCFPPNSTLDGFKPNPATAVRMRTDLIGFVSKILAKHSVPKFRAIY